jgi:hypothetical protein
MSDYSEDEATPEMFAEAYGCLPDQAVVLTEHSFREELLRVQQALVSEYSNATTTSSRDRFNIMRMRVETLVNLIDIAKTKQLEAREKMALLAIGCPNVKLLKQAAEEYVRNMQQPVPSARQATELKNLIFERALEVFHGEDIWGKVRE